MFISLTALNHGAKRVAVCLSLSALFVRPTAQTPEPPPWPDTFLARLEAFALIQTLNAEILANRSATVSLENWCRDHELAAEPKIVARVVKGADKPPTNEQRQRLEVSGENEVKYRRVELRCGARVLSEADNWYVPGRLTPEMNRLLDTTDAPFGRVVESLVPYRRTFTARLLWTPLPDGWERAAVPLASSRGGTLAIPDAVLEHRAVLYSREHKPFSEVDEVYQRAILAFRPPSGR
jgi:chorismate-pyruvate lyase